MRNKISIFILIFLFWKSNLYSEGSNKSSAEKYSDDSWLSILSGINLYDIDINSAFNGVDILIFAVRNNKNDFAGNILGPERKYLVSKREKFLGFWVKKKSVIFENVPSYYSFWVFAENKASLENILDFYQIGFDSLNFKVDQNSSLSKEEISEFKNAFIEHMKKRRLFSGPNQIIQTNNNLFKISSFIPDKTSVGSYYINLFSFDKNAFQEVDFEVKMNFFVKHLNLNKFLSNLNNNHSKLYLVFLCLMAIVNIFIIRFIIIKK